jgi:aminoglycoside phosphotransferase (APT) family kinase protein
MAGVTAPLHEDELPVDIGLVRALVRQQLPEYAALPLRRLESSGSDNALFRLGDELLVRMPRQPGGGRTIAKEARWLPHVAPHLPVATPDIVAVGDAADGYPEKWSVVRWLRGSVPEPVDPAAGPDPWRRTLAEDLAAVVRALSAVAVPPAARTSPELRWYRGEPLARRDDDTRLAIEQCRAIDGLGLDLDAVDRVWAEAMRLPGVDEAAEDRWYHGDLAPENLLVDDGRLAAVLDFGGLAVGDATIDLVGAWEVLDAPARDVFRRGVDVDEVTWLRGRAWALSLALITFPYYWRTMPARCRSRLAAARAVLADAAG